jgi:Tfp pilus assembly protein FimT
MIMIKQPESCLGKNKMGINKYLGLRGKSKGYTLIEILVVLFCLSLFLYPSYLAFDHIIQKAALEYSARELVSDLRYLRTITMGEDVKSPQVELYSILLDNNRYFFLKGLKSQFIKTLSKNITIYPYNKKIMFNRSGILLSENFTITLENRNKEFRYITILNATGRIKLSDHLEN